MRYCEACKRQTGSRTLGLLVLRIREGVSYPI